MQTTRHRVILPHLPPHLNGLRVAQLSDFHRSRLTSDALIAKAVARVVQEAPDLIVLTGDFVNSDPADIEPCMNLLAPLVNSGIAPLGVYAVHGNHDVKAGLEPIQQALEASGIDYLRNQSRLLANGVWVVGLDEDWYGTPDVEAAFAGIPHDAPIIVLAHNPGEADLVADRACVAFSGHTHGGQIRLPLLTNRVVKWIKAKHYRAGWYTTGKAQLYVNRGIGNADVPFRFLCPPEVAFFTLHSQAE